MKSLYDPQFNTLNADAIFLDAEVEKFVKHRISMLHSKGYNPREVSHVIIDAVMAVESEFVLREANRKYNEKKTCQCLKT